MWNAGDVVDEFRIEELLGEGGNCLVYRAVDEELGRVVALKVAATVGVDVDDLARRQARLAREARALARVQSNRVARVHGLRRVDGAGVVVVLEFVGGTTLAKLLQRQRQLSVDRALQLGHQIAVGMQAIHDVGLVHRDLKPHNVMVDVVDGCEHAKVIDLGIAKAPSSLGKNDGLTRAEDIVGTLGFMAPEQILRKDVDAAADVWSFGAVLYRMLCGAPVFAATTLPALIRATVDGVARPLRDRVPHHRVPAAVDALVLQCLQKDPRERPLMAEVAYRLASLDGAADDVTVRAERTRRAAALPASVELTPTLESPSSKRSRSALPSLPSASASLVAVRDPALPRPVTMFGVSIHEEPTLSGT